MKLKLPQWNAFKRQPKLLVVLFFFITILLYFDRGCISGLLPKVKKRWGTLTGVQEGLISSAFTVSFIIFCPLFAHVASMDWVAVNHIMTFGFFFWGLSAILCGVFSTVSIGRQQFWGYYCFVTSRTLVGVGESAFIALSVSIVDDVASDSNRSSYQSVLLGGVPIGTALGYTIAGSVSAILPWQYIFFVEGVVGLIVSFMFIFIPITEAREKAKQDKLMAKVESSKDKELAAEKEEMTELTSGKKKSYNLFSAIYRLLLNPTYLMLVLGKSQYIGVVGALSFWAPSWLLDRLSSFDISEDKKLMVANFGFSAILIVASILGTLIGGVILDRMGKRNTETKEALLPTRGSLLITIFVALSIPLGLVVFIWTTINIYALFAIFAVAIILLFCCSSPFQIAILSSCDEELRDFAISFQILFLRVLGDLPSPTVFGWFADLTNSLDIANVIIWCLLILCALCYALATIFAFVKYRKLRNTTVSQ